MCAYYVHHGVDNAYTLEWTHNHSYDDSTIVKRSVHSDFQATHSLPSF